MITGVINARNEEATIDLAIASLLSFVDEVVVADMASTDRTVDIARSLGARVISVPDFGFVEPAKRMAVDSASHDWVVTLDADEVIPPSLGRRLREIASNGTYDGVRVAFATFMFGERVRHTGWSPQQERHLRMFHRDRVEFPNETHTEVVLLPGYRLLELPDDEDLLVRHYNYRGWSHFVEKLNRYTSLEARHILEGGRRLTLGGVLLRAGRELVWRYFYRAGFKDGVTGLVLSLLMTVYRLLVFTKHRELSEVGGEAEILARYRADAARSGIPVSSTELENPPGDA